MAGRWGRRRGDIQNLGQAGSSLVNSKSVTLLSSPKTQPHKGSLLWPSCKQRSTAHFYSPLSLPLRTRIPFLYTVQLGSVDRDNLDEGVILRVSRIVIHPTYSNVSGDIALLRLFSRVTYSSSILPICLSNVKKKRLIIPDSCWVTGWGKLKQEGENAHNKGVFYTSPSCTHFRVFILWAFKYCSKDFLQNQINRHSPEVFK